MATAEKLTLAERMTLARERTMEARDARAAAKAKSLAPPVAALPPTRAPLAARALTLPMALGQAHTVTTTSTPTRPTDLGSVLGAHSAARTAASGAMATAAPSGALAKPAPRAASVHSHPKGNNWQVQGQAGEQLNLMPGQLHFGGHVAGLRTLLGSCVAVTIWHPVRKLGGMCHFLLPSRARKPGDELDGRYGDEALLAMVNMLRAAGTSPNEYQAHLCGGADTMPEGSGTKFNVGERNIEQGFSLVDRYGFEIQGVDVGEDVPRTVTLVLATGEVDMRRGKGRAPVLDMAGAAAVRR